METEANTIDGVSLDESLKKKKKKRKKEKRNTPKKMPHLHHLKIRGN